MGDRYSACGGESYWNNHECKFIKVYYMYSVFIILSSHSIYGLKVPQGTGRIFLRFAPENLHLQ